MQNNWKSEKKVKQKNKKRSERLMVVVAVVNKNHDYGAFIDTKRISAARSHQGRWSSPFTNVREQKRKLHEHLAGL